MAPKKMVPPSVTAAIEAQMLRELEEAQMPKGAGKGGKTRPSMPVRPGDAPAAVRRGRVVMEDIAGRLAPRVASASDEPSGPRAPAPEVPPGVTGSPRSHFVTGAEIPRVGQRCDP